MSITLSKEFTEFAEELYLSVVGHNQKVEENLKLLSAPDEQLVPGFPSFNVGNLRNTLLGGETSQCSTFQELLHTRMFYEGRYSLITNPLDQTNNDQYMYMNDLKQHLCVSTCTIVTKIFPQHIQRLFMTHGNKLKQPSVVLYLYGISQKEQSQRLDIRSLQLSLRTRIDVLQECVKIHHEHTHASRFINNKIAKMAYSRIVTDPQGTSRPTINLNHFARNFPIVISHAIYTHGLIDQWHEPSIYKIWRGTNFQESPSCSHKHIEYYTDKGNKSSKKTFWVIVIDQAFTQPFWDEFTNAIENLKFLAGIRGKNDLYVRCSNNEQAPFAVGKTRTAIYPSQTMDKCEEKITNLARFVMKFQRCYVQSLVGSDFLVTWDVNMLHYIVGPIKNAVYAAHNDSSPLLCSPSNTTRTHVVDVAHLPLMDEMQVLTMYWTNLDDDLDSSQYNIDMNYYFFEKKIAQLPLTGRGIHIQGPGSQSSGITHETKVRGKFESNIYRGVCTTRLSVTPRNGDVFNEAKSKLTVGSHTLEDTEYVYTQVQHKCVSHVQMQNHQKTESEQEVQSFFNQRKRKSTHCSSDFLKILPTKLNHTKQLKDTPTDFPHSYAPIDQEHAKLLSQKFPSSYKTLPARLGTSLRQSLVTIDHSISIGPISHQLTRGESIEQMFSAGYLLNLKCDNHIIPCLYHFHRNPNECLSVEQFPLPGKHYKLPLICADAGVDHNSRTHQALNPKIGSHRIIILTKGYKQNPLLMDNYIKWLDLTFNSTTPEPFEEVFAFDGTAHPMLHVYGSGGARTLSGEKPPTACSSKHDPLLYVGPGQDINNPVNSELLKMASRLHVVAIFLNEAKYYGDHCNGHDPKMCRFLGYFQINNAILHSGDSEEFLLQQFPNLREEEKRFLSFRLQPHLRVEAHPLIATMKQIQSLYLSGSNKRLFKQLCIDHDCKDNIPFIDYLPRPKGPGITSKTLSFQTRDAIKQFIAYGHIERYVMATPTVGTQVYTNRTDTEDIKPTPNGKLLRSYTENYIDQSKGTFADISDMVYACVYASIASALRFTRMGMLEAENTIYAGALPTNVVGATLECRPTAHPNRCLDVVCMFAREVTHDSLYMDKSKTTTST